MAEHRRGAIYEDPDLLLLNATLHRMERDHHLDRARRARNWAWLCGAAAYHRSLLRARNEHFLSKLLQHTAEVFQATPRLPRPEIQPAERTPAERPAAGRQVLAMTDASAPA